jgi:hypothetical protein
MLKLWPVHRYTCNKHTRIMLDPTMSPMYADDNDLVYFASQVRLGNEEGKRPDFWLVLPAEVQHMLPQYMDAKSLCRTDSIMTNVLAREAWNIALKGTPSVALSRWPQYSSLDKFKGLRWSRDRRVALEGINLWKVMNSDSGHVWTDVGMQFLNLCQIPKFVDIAVMLVESKSIDANMTITVPEGFSNDVLHVASQLGRLPVVQALLQAGATVDKADDHGHTPLHTASSNGHLAILHALMQAGADVNKVDKYGQSPLYATSQQGHLSVVEALLQAGADVDKAACHGATPVYIASKEGHLPIVRALQKAGADVDKSDVFGLTPLRAAIIQQHPHIVSFLERVSPLPYKVPQATLLFEVSIAALYKIVSKLILGLLLLVFFLAMLPVKRLKSFSLLSPIVSIMLE